MVQGIEKKTKKKVLDRDEVFVLRAGGGGVTGRGGEDAMVGYSPSLSSV